jgi:predicted secreted protein
MTWFTGIVVYILVWWVTLFAVLPFWVTPSEPDDPGYPAGAPKHPRLVLKAVVTSAVATIIWLVIFLIVRSPWLSFRGP